MNNRARAFGQFLAAGDVALTLLALYLADVIRHALPFGATAQNLDWLTGAEYVIVAVIWAFFLRFTKLYDHRRVLRIVDEARALMPGVLIATAALFAAFFVLKLEFLSRLLFLYFLVLDIAFLINFRWILNLVVRSRRFSSGTQRRILIAGAGPVGDRVSRLILDRPWSGMDVVGFADDDMAKSGNHLNTRPVLGTTTQLPEIVRSHAIDEVVIALPMRAHDRVYQIAIDLERENVAIRLVPDVFHLMPGRAVAEDVWGIPMISVRAPAIIGFDRVVKRLFDLSLGAVTLIVMTPIMAMVSLAVYLQDGRSVIFAQRRVGENGRLFTMYKFRTMIRDVNTRPESAQHRDQLAADDYKPLNNPRVTPIGRFLRRTSLDELPQLWNVLRGEMSLVGPRPELPWVVEQYDSWQRQRLTVLPGITGWWQVNGRSDLPLRDNVEYDLFYIQNYSPLLDFSILLRTIWVVARGRGAY